jgi:hypothetical protein
MEAMGRAFTSCHSTLMRQKDVDTELSGGWEVGWVQEYQHYVGYR